MKLSNKESKTEEKFSPSFVAALCLILLLICTVVVTNHLLATTDKWEKTIASIENTKDISGSATEIDTESTENISITEDDSEKIWKHTEDTAQKGWIKTDDVCLYYGKEGIPYTGWHYIDGKKYYFDENGAMLKDQWVDDSYVDASGAVIKDTFTPDGHYVDMYGMRDDIVCLKNSREGLIDLRNTITEMTDGYSGTWSVYVKNINTNEYMAVNNVQQYSASLMKLFCAATLYDLEERGKLEWDDNIERLMTAMISVSDNDAFNLLVRKCTPSGNHVNGRAIIQEYIDANDYPDTTITSALYPTSFPAPSSPGRNYTTVIDCGLFMERVLKRQVVTEEVSDKLLTLMLNQKRTGKIPAGLPQGTKCANKTGETDETQHDAAIVYSPNATYILVVMSSNCGAAIGNIQKISREVYSYFNPDAQSDDCPPNLSISRSPTKYPPAR